MGKIVVVRFFFCRVYNFVEIGCCIEWILHVVNSNVSTSTKPIVLTRQFSCCFDT